MEITLLGTSAGTPTSTRNVSATAIKLRQKKEWLLFDCGESTQNRLMQTSLSPGNLEKIFITHLHGDHVYGIFGLLASRGLHGIEKSLEIYAPAGIGKMIDTVTALSALKLPFKIDIHELKGDETIYFDGYRIECVELSHSIFTLGYVLIENDRPGKLNLEKAKKLKIPPGPQYARLKRGENIMLEDGRIIKSKDILEPEKKGRKVIIGGDNDKPELFKKYTCAELMIHEATYTQSDFEKLEKKYRHSTAKQLAVAAERMKVECLVMNHISPRYDTPARLNELLNEASKYYSGQLILAEDLMKIKV